MGAVLVTGAAGFIGSFVALRLLERGATVVGLDNLNDYYDPRLKQDRLARLQPHAGFSFERVDLADRAAMQGVFARHRFDSIVHLAAQAGVRYSLTHPHAYVDSNLAGMVTVLEGARAQQVRHLVYASSSSVYGANTKLPFATTDPVERPVSLYAATKRANELMAYVYAMQFGVPATGLRLFTVYGPWGRPDMAAIRFTRAILAGEPIEVYNHGDMQRDFTYIDDIVEGVIRTSDHTAPPNPAWDSDCPDPATSTAPYRIYNIGNNNPVELMHLIGTLEQALGRTAVKNMLPMQPGDVPATYADVAALEQDVGFAPKTSIETGVARFVAWYRAYYGA